MKVVVVAPFPPEVDALIERRRALGLDRHDEVWEGVHHMIPGPSGTHAVVAAELLAVLRPYGRAAGLTVTTEFNVGDGPDDFRVPDGGFHRGVPTGTWIPTSAVVVEVLSPGDETFEKFAFYAAHGVDEVIVADPAERTVRVFARAGAGYEEAPVSVVLGVTAAQVAAEVEWP